MYRLPLALTLGALAALPLRAHDDPGRARTITYVQQLQAPAGGFVAAADGKAGPTLRATSTAVRTLRYLGGKSLQPAGAARFVERCFDPTTGGFADTPGGTPDVFTTAVGLMAVAELKLPLEKYGPPAAAFLDQRAKGFEEIRIAAAGFEALGQKPPKADAWAREVAKLRGPDGHFGDGPGRARATGGAVAALLRLGADLPDRDQVVKDLKAGQRPSGGYGKEDSEITADLETTYRVMRSFVMLKARPDSVEGVRSFLAKCRNAEGGYGVAPGQPSSVSGTYYAAIIRHWLDRKE